MLRIIAGERRGRKIEVPSGGGVRPTTDRVREAIFNILRRLVEKSYVFDLFAGSGALGLEALSRGAEHVTFIEGDSRVAGTLRRNIKHLGYEARATLVVADAFRWVERFEAWPSSRSIILIAPPYACFEERLEDLRQLWSTLVERMAPGTAIAMQAPQNLQRDWLPPGADWELRRYGQTQVVIGQTIESNQTVTSDATACGEGSRRQVSARKQEL